MLTVIAYGVAGFLVTGALTAGAWALAGKDISHPAPITVPAQAIQASPKPTEPPHEEGKGKHEDRSDDHASPSPGSEHDGSSGTSGSSGTDSGDSTSSGSSGSSGSSDSSSSDHGSEDHASEDHESGDD